MFSHDVNLKMASITAVISLCSVLQCRNSWDERFPLRANIPKVKSNFTVAVTPTTTRRNAARTKRKTEVPDRPVGRLASKSESL